MAEGMAMPDNPIPRAYTYCISRRHFFGDK
jgi:hypothetical protein